MTTKVIGDNTTGSPAMDYAGTDDAKLRQGAATTNYGSLGTSEITKFGAGDHAHTVLTFTGLSNIAGPIVVDSVTLGLYMSDGSGAGAHTVDIRRLLRNWVEAQATWNIYSTGNNWGTAGGISDGVDRVAAASAQLTLGPTIGQYYTVTDAGQLAQDVEDWINGVNANYGWHLSRNGAGEDSTFREIATSENGSTDHRPYLSVTYHTASGVAAVANFHLQQMNR